MASDHQDIGTKDGASRPRPRSVVVSLAFAAAIAIATYLISLAGPQGAVGVSILLLLPSVLSAFVAWVISTRRTLTGTDCFTIPIWIVSGVCFLGLFVFQEGIICLVMAAPPWIIAGWLGVWPVYRLRRKVTAVDPEIFRAHALLLVPLLALAIEAQVAPPREAYIVRSDLVVNATPKQVWQELTAIPDVKPYEGKRNFSQDILGIPRPIGSNISGVGVGAVRTGHWQEGIMFQEIISHWNSNRAMEWRFAFPDDSIALKTDPHIHPHGRQLWIDKGGYRLSSLPKGQTRVELWTQYSATSWFNGYAAIWGEVMLGDIQDNVLSIIKQRSEGVLQ